MLIRELVLRSWQHANWLTVLLWPLSLVYGAVFAVNRSLYRLGIKSSYKAPVPLIVVGNLTVGGTGKTPMVIFLIEQLRAKGYSPGVISRGYHGDAAAIAVQVKPDSLVSEVGDEPAMIVHRTQVPMVISANRRAACEMLLKSAKIDIIISDDGLQHHALVRDVEICLLDATTNHTNRYLLPAGSYRESSTRLDSVDFVVEHQSISANMLSRRPGSFSMQLEASEPTPLKMREKNDNETNNFDAARLTHAVAGIGNPQRFFDTCLNLGYTIKEYRFPDHYRFSDSDLDFGPSAQILMTEKDAVKCARLDNTNRWYLPVDAKLETGFIEALIEKLKKTGKQIR